MCDLLPVDLAGVVGLPSADDLTSELSQLTQTLADQLGNGETLTVMWRGKGKKATKDADGTGDGE